MQFHIADDSITYSGTGGSVSMHPVDVALVGWADRASATTGTIVKFDVAPSPADVGGFSVATDALEWQWVPDDATLSGIWNPGCSRHCEIFVDYSGTMYARAYTNGTMKIATVAHIEVADQLQLKATPTYGPAGYQATFTASNSDGAGVYNTSWSFKPDSSSTSITPTCGSANPCVWSVPQSGTMTVTALVHNRYKKATAHVEVVPCPQNDPFQDNPDFRRLERTIWDSSNTAGPDSIRIERVGFLLDSAGVYKTFVAPILGNTSCTFGASWPNLPGWNVVAIVHTHPWPDNAILTNGRGCPAGQAYGDNPSTGWMSGWDWHISDANHLPSYAVDFNRVIRIRGDSANVHVILNASGQPIVDPMGHTFYAPDSAGKANHMRKFQRTGGACSATSARIPLIAGGILRDESSARDFGQDKPPALGKSRRPATSRIVEGN